MQESRYYHIDQLSSLQACVIFALIAVAAAAPTTEWENFKKTYNKVYRSYGEELKRKALFQETLEFVNEHNAKYAAGLSTFNTAINERSDWTNAVSYTHLTLPTKRIV